MSKIFRPPPSNYEYLVGLENLVFVDRRAGPNGGNFVNFVLQQVTIEPNTFAQLQQKMYVKCKGKVNSLAAITEELVIDGVVAVSQSVGSSGGANRIFMMESIITLETSSLITLCNSGRTNVTFVAAMAAIGDNYGYNEVTPFDPTIPHTIQHRLNGGGATESVFDSTMQISII